MERCNYINYDRRNIDFNVVQYGYRRCDPGFGEKPNIWRNFLLHCVYDGKGALYADGKRIAVEKNQAFMIFPGQIASYIADEDDPFEYRWIEFYGDGMKRRLPDAGVSVTNPIIDDGDGRVGAALKNIVDRGQMGNAALMSAFWALAEALGSRRTDDVSQTERYVQRAVDFIQASIGRKITVEDVCRELNISRNYFTDIFTKSMGISPKRYIVSRHMEMAMELLRRTKYSVSEIAYIVGYNNPMEFTKAFARFAGVSPSEYRKSASEQALHRMGP